MANWLTCAVCQAPLVHREELELTVIPVLTDAVYTYRLEMLGSAEVPVYSATNAESDRFDLVVVKLSESTGGIPFDDQTARDEIQFLHSLRRSAPNRLVDPHIALLELETLQHEEATDESESENDFSVSPIVLFKRVRTNSCPVPDHSWFPPYPWTIAECARCNSQIGWTFWSKEAGRPEFFSLIVTRLREKIL